MWSRGREQKQPSQNGMDSQRDGDCRYAPEVETLLSLGVIVSSHQRSVKNGLVFMRWNPRSPALICLDR